MEVLKNIKKIMAIGLIGAIAIGASGCTQHFSQDKVNEMVNTAKLEAYNAGVASVDITSDNADVVKAMEPQVQEAIAKAVADQKAKDDLVLEDVKAVVAELKAEDKAVEEEKANVIASYEKDDLVLNSAVSPFVLDDSDLKFLQDKKIRFDDEDDIDIHEELRFNNLSIKTSVADEDFKDNVYLTLDASDAVEYRYVFDDSINKSLVTKDEPLKINFLGQDLEIIDVTNSKFTAVFGEKLLLTEREEQSIVIDGKNVSVKLLAVSDNDNKISIQVDNGVEIGLNEGDSERVGSSDYEVYVESVMSNDDGEGKDIAEIRVGKDVKKDFKNNDEVDDYDDRFVYKMSFSGDMIDYLGVSYDEISDHFDDEYQPITVSDKLVFPNDFASISLDVDDVDYIDYDFSFSKKNGVDSIKMKSSDDEGFYIGSDKVNRVYFNGTNAIYDDDNGDEHAVALNTVNVVNDEISLDLSNVGTDFMIGSKINFTYDPTLNYLGSTESEEDPEDISYNGVHYGEVKETLVTNNGIKILSPEANAKNDKVKITVPSDIVKATIKVE